MCCFPSEWGKVPWSLSPKDKKSPLQGFFALASHLAWRCLMPLDSVGISYRNGGHPWRWWASRSCSAGSYLQSCGSWNVLYRSMSDTLLRCLLAHLLVCIFGWSDRILGGIGVVLPKISTWDHGRTYLVDDDSNALESIQSRWSSQCVHTKERGLRWQEDARWGMCHPCLLLPEYREAISGLPPSSRCPSCTWSPSWILEGEAPIV